MRKIACLILPVCLSSASIAAASEGGMLLSRDPSQMSGAEIDAYNQGRGPTDADYIRCRRIEQVGSLVRKIRVCNTNAEWKRLADKDNQEARDSMEAMGHSWSNSQEPRDGLMPAVRPQ